MQTFVGIDFMGRDAALEAYKQPGLASIDKELLYSGFQTVNMAEPSWQT